MAPGAHGELIMRLSRRFAAAGAAAALLPLLAYGALSISALREGTRRSVSDGLAKLTDRTAAQLDAWVVHLSAQVAALGGEFERTGLDRWQQEHALRNWVARFPEFRELTLFDAAGRPVASSRLSLDGLSPPTLDRDGPHGTRVSRVAIDDDLLPVMHAGIDVEARDGSREAIAATLSLEEIWRVVDGLRVGQDGYALLVDNRGRLVAHGHPGRKRAIARGEALDAHPLARPDLPAPSLLAPTEYVDPAGARYLAVAARLPSLGWLLILEQPTSEAFALADRLQGWLVAAICAALAVTIALGGWLGRSLITPITTLVAGTEAVAAGRLDTRVSLRGGDEFTRLGDAFNDMAARLSDLQETARRQERQAMFGRIVSGLVHDLSHPVYNLANGSRLLARRPEDTEYRDTFVRAAERETATLKRLLDDLRQVGSPAQLQHFRLDLVRGVRDAVDGIRPAAEAATLQVEVDAPPEPLHVEGDAFGLGRVWRNLLQNAVEATPPGGRIRVHAARVGTQAVVRISDTGRGIEPARLPRLFDEFVTSKHRGLGLGLAICRRVIDQLGGEIRVTSEAGEGTTFEVALPIAPDERDGEAMAAAARDASRAGGEHA